MPYPPSQPSTANGTLPYDEMSQQLYWAEAGYQFAAFGTHIGDNDNIYNTLRSNNSIRYASPKIKGLSFATTYAFSNSTAFADNSAFSAGANYAVGPFQFGAAYAIYRNPGSSTNTLGAIDTGSWGTVSPFTRSARSAAPTSQQRIAGLAASYTFGSTQAAFNYSNVLFTYRDATTLKLQNLEAMAILRATTALLIGAGYIYTAGQYSSGGAPHWHQLDLGTVYSLSKRTELFAYGVFQRAGGSAAFTQIYSLGASNSGRQTALLAGIRTRF